jgi:prepilin-type N-terminal cleavage/methylation domain-containing protein
MLRLAVRKETGFSLIEAMVTVVIVGIFGAIAAPSFSAWSDRYKLDNALAKLQGALQEVQQQSIRTSQPCSVTIDTTALTVASTSGYANCLPTGSRSLNNTGLSSNSTQSAGFAMVTDAVNTTPAIAFTFRGTTSTVNVFVVYKPNSSIPMKCLAISQGIGMIRIGRYNSPSNPPASVSASNCETKAQ